jgi:hypothetical protein
MFGTTSTPTRLALLAFSSASAPTSRFLAIRAISSYGTRSRLRGVAGQAERSGLSEETLPFHGEAREPVGQAHRMGKSFERRYDENLVLVISHDLDEVGHGSGVEVGVEQLTERKDRLESNSPIVPPLSGSHHRRVSRRRMRSASSANCSPCTASSPTNNDSPSSACCSPPTPFTT